MERLTSLQNCLMQTYEGGDFRIFSMPLVYLSSIYDPLGFLAPVIIQGKLILRKLTSSTFDWDDPVPDDIASEGIPRRVTGLLSGDKWKRNILVLASRSKSFRFVARSLDGKADITSKLFDANL
jgi:hypothetical protein